MSKESNQKELLDVHNRVSSDKLKIMVRNRVKAIINGEPGAEYLRPLFVWGAPGIGKSSIIKSVAKELGVPLIDIRLSQREPVDIRGLPVPDNENKCVKWYVTGDLPRGEDTKGIILFDELSAASRDLQVAAYQLILDRCLGDDYKVPKKWAIIAAGNRTQDRAVSTTISSALANRFIHVEMESCVEDWIPWAQAENIHPSVIGFVQWRSEFLHKMEKENLERGWPSPRSWEAVSQSLNLWENNPEDKNHSILRTEVFGSIGNGVGAEFMNFFINNAMYINVLEYMRNPKMDLKIPDTPDGRYALVSSMCYLLWRGDTPEERQLRIDGFYRIMMKLSPDFASLAMLWAMYGDNKDKTSGEGTYAEMLFKHKSYKEFDSKYGKALRKRLEF